MKRKFEQMNCFLSWFLVAALAVVSCKTSHKQSARSSSGSSSSSSSNAGNMFLGATPIISTGACTISKNFIGPGEGTGLEMDFTGPKVKCSVHTTCLYTTKWTGSSCPSTGDVCADIISSRYVKRNFEPTNDNCASGPDGAWTQATSASAISTELCNYAANNLPGGDLIIFTPYYHSKDQSVTYGKTPPVFFTECQSPQNPDQYPPPSQLTCPSGYTPSVVQTMPICKLIPPSKNRAKIGTAYPWNAFEVMIRNQELPWELQKVKYTCAYKRPCNDTFMLALNDSANAANTFPDDPTKKCEMLGDSKVIQAGCIEMETSFQKDPAYLQLQTYWWDSKISGGQGITVAAFQAWVKTQCEGIFADNGPAIEAKAAKMCDDRFLKLYSEHSPNGLGSCCSAVVGPPAPIPTTTISSSGTSSTMPGTTSSTISTTSATVSPVSTSILPTTATSSSALSDTTPVTTLRTTRTMNPVPFYPVNPP